MPTWILRKNVDNERLGHPHSCAGPKDTQRVIGLLTVDERIATMLADDEKAEPGREGSRKIFSGEQVVGYIVVLSTDIS